MESTKERRRRRRTARTDAADTVELRLKNSQGATETLSARLADVSEFGVGVDTDQPLMVGARVEVYGRFFDPESNHAKSAFGNVIHCRLTGEKTYRTGIALDGPERRSSSNGRSAAVSDSSFVDYYEILQLSPTATTDTIHRVYRFLAQRYHPDNPETGNVEVFRQVLQAYRTLSDPEQRAAYDVDYHASRSLKWKIFQKPEDAEGVEEEKRKRWGVLTVLLRKRKEEPMKPGMTLRELEGMLGCPREHLEFTLWYLKSKSYIQAEDSGRVSITVHGVDVAEELSETRFGQEQPERLLLREAPGQGSGAQPSGASAAEKNADSG